MWHWQLNALFKDFFTFSKRRQFFVQLCLLTLFAHVLFFLIISLLSYGLQSNERFVVSSQPKSELYVLSPLQKHVVQSKKDRKRRRKSVASSKVIDEQTYKREKKKQKAGGKEFKRVEQQAMLEITEVKEIVDKPSVEKKQSKQKRTIHKPQKSSVALVEKTIIQQDEKKIQEQQVTKKDEEEKVEQDLQQTDLDLDNATFVGYKDLDHVMIQETIAQAVQQYFKPPVGIDSDVSVELRVQVGSQGNVIKADVVRSSGIVVYDSSARAAVYKATLPKEVSNKTVIIVLGQ